MGQFEYAVPLSSVKPEDIERLAIEYREKQKREAEPSLIKYEFDTLVLDSSHTKQDQKAIDMFVESQIKKERERILEDLEAQSNGYGTLSIAKFKLREIVTGKAY
jgi:hypothetical protein